MEIDFHFAVTYVVGRVAGLSHEESQIVATSSQYVDDTVNKGVVQFKSGESYDRISTAHDMLDYHILLPIEERRTWVPFHFLPGNELVGKHRNEFYNRIVCRPNSPVAQAMLKNCIENKSRKFSLHQLGITAHVYIDTWAHQGFAGVNHPINSVRAIKLIEPKGKKSILKTLKETGIVAALWHLIQPKLSELFDAFFPMGHGAALHYPDHPFRVWSYKNGQGELVMRHNPSDFLEAADELCKFIRRYILGDSSAVVAGLPQEIKDCFEKKILEYQDEDGLIRNQRWLESIRNGEFGFEKVQLNYVSSGIGSWKAEALGIMGEKVPPCRQFKFSPQFMNSHWKLFHDAAKAHQHEMLSEILPAFGISVI